MKKTLIAIIAAGTLLFGCDGTQGPQGPEGPQGADGLLGEVFEVDNVSFTSGNSYAVSFDFNPAIYQNDKVVGYILSGADNNGDDNWEPLPQTIFYEGNTYLFTFDFSKNGFTFYLDANVNPGLLPSDFRLNRVFRVLVIPAELVNKVNTNDINDVMAKMGINENSVQELNTPVISL